MEEFAEGATGAWGTEQMRSDEWTYRVVWGEPSGRKGTSDND